MKTSSLLGPNAHKQHGHTTTKKVHRKTSGCVLQGIFAKLPDTMLCPKHFGSLRPPSVAVEASHGSGSSIADGSTAPTPAQKDYCRPCGAHGCARDAARDRTGAVGPAFLG